MGSIGSDGRPTKFGNFSNSPTIVRTVSFRFAPQDVDLSPTFPARSVSCGPFLVDLSRAGGRLTRSRMFRAGKTLEDLFLASVSFLERPNGRPAPPPLPAGLTHSHGLSGSFFSRFVHWKACEDC